MLRFVAPCVLTAVFAATPTQAGVDAALLLQNPYAAPTAGHPATLEIEATTTGDGRTAHQRVSLADAWVAASEDGTATVFDFAKNRLFTVRDGTLESRNPAALPIFRVMEFQNRALLSRVVSAAVKEKGPLQALAPCDVANELGVVLPMRGYGAEAKVERSASGGRLVCGGREYGRFEAGDRPAPPTFWPYLANTFSMHPALLAALKQDGRIPRSVTVAYQVGEETRTRTWALGEARAVQSQSPLQGDLPIRGGSDLPEPVRARLGALAEAAVAGKAAGGAPQSFADWDVRVRAAERQGGKGAAFFEAMVGMHMLSPDGRCTAKGSATCGQLAEIRELVQDEAAVTAFFNIIQAEQTGPAGAAVDALASVQDPKLRDHPVLGAAYALALHKLSAEEKDRARKSSLSTDPLELHIKALEAYPYSPAYWSDLGDWFAGQYDYASALYCWDVAANLPVPSVRPELTGVMLGKRNFIQRIRTDFPEFFAP